MLETTKSQRAKPRASMNCPRTKCRPCYFQFLWYEIPHCLTYIFFPSKFVSFYIYFFICMWIECMCVGMSAMYMSWVYWVVMSAMYVSWVYVCVPECHVCELSICVWAWVPWCMYGDQRTTHWSWFSTFIIFLSLVDFLAGPCLLNIFELWVGFKGKDSCVSCIGFEIDMNGFLEAGIEMWQEGKVHCSLN